MFRKLLCWLGSHGPNWHGNESCKASSRDGNVPFNRTCLFCGEVWYGTQVYGRYTRYLGDWKTKQQLIATGEWRELTKHKEKPC